MITVGTFCRYLIFNDYTWTNYLDRLINSITFSDNNKNNLKSHIDDNSGINGNHKNSVQTSTGTERPSNQGDTSTMTNYEKNEAKKSILILIGIFLISLTVMFYVYLMFPKLEE